MLARTGRRPIAAEGGIVRADEHGRGLALGGTAVAVSDKLPRFGSVLGHPI